MSKTNLVDLNTWIICADEYGSGYEYLDSSLKTLDENGNVVIGAKVFKIKTTNAYDPWVTLLFLLNFEKDTSYFSLSKCQSIRLTYKTDGKFPLNLYFQDKGEDNPENLSYFKLPAVKQWKTVTLFMKDRKPPLNTSIKKSDLSCLSGICFQFNMPKNSCSEFIFIKEFVFNGFYHASLVDSKSREPINYLYKNPLLFFLKKQMVFFQILFTRLKSLRQESEKAKAMYSSSGDKLYCLYPFFNLRIDPDKFTPCCWVEYQKKAVPAGGFNLKEVWESKKFNFVRESIKNRSFSYCNISNCSKSDVFKRHFHTLEEIETINPDVYQYLKGRNKRISNELIRLEVAFDTVCNLSCKSCDQKTLPRYTSRVKEVIFDEIEKIGENVEILYLTGMGDPFGTPSYRNWLKSFPANKFKRLKRIIFQTNGIMWTKELWNQLPPIIKTVFVEARISIDGATKEIYEENRGGADYSKLIDNLDSISFYRKKGEIDYLSFDCVIQQNNFREIPLIIDMAKKFLSDEVSFSRITNWGTYDESAFARVDVLNPKHQQYEDVKEIIDLIKNQKNHIKIEFAF